MTIAQPQLRTLRTIPTPWPPYAMVFSPDGSRLAIGGGTANTYGHGGLLLVDHASGDSARYARKDVPQLGGGAVTGLCFSADGKHLVASVWGRATPGGRLVVLAVDGLALRASHAIELDYTIPLRLCSLPSSVVLHEGTALVRNHCSVVADMVLAQPLPAGIAHGPVRSQRLVVVGDQVVTGNQGELQVLEHTGGAGEYGLGRLVIAPLARLDAPEVIDIEDGSCVTALARLGDRLISGGRRGELDAWSLDGRWQRHRVRQAPPGQAPLEQDLTLLSGYQETSIVDLCAIPHGGAASVSISGELCLFDAETRFVTHAVPVPGSPRSLAAHPDGGALAIGIKQRGVAAASSAVVVLDLRPAIAPAWRSPVVRTLAAAAARGDRDAFVVLADALEEIGAAPELVHHLRHHDHALTRCWAIDALVES